MSEPTLENRPIFRLCYVNPPWAYFTTQRIAEQWGDDWDDSPFEHNAGRPYEWRERDGTPPWEIMRIAYDGDLVPPNEGHFNSPWSVKAINRGAVAWLRTDQYHNGEVVLIFAGETLDEVCRKIREAGGAVYCEARR